MKRDRFYFWVILTAASLLISACGQKAQATESVKPAVVEAVAGMENNRITLTEKAASRLDIKTEAVRIEQVKRVRIMVGEVVVSPLVPNTGEGEMAALPGETYVRLHLNESDSTKVDLTQSALILADDEDEDEDEDEDGLLGELFDDEDFDDGEDNDLGETVYFKINDNTGKMLSIGDNVRVAVTLAGTSSPQKVVPFSALLYDLEGKTFVYVNPEPLVYIRELVTVDYTFGDTTVLIDGPDEGTQVVTVGAAELYGADTGVGK